MDILEGIKYFYLMGTIFLLILVILIHPILRKKSHDNKK